MLSSNMNPNSLYAPYYFIIVDGYHGSTTLWQPGWVYVQDDCLDPADTTFQVLQPNTIEPGIPMLPGGQYAPNSTSPQATRSPLKPPQNFATQTLRDENPDKFVLSLADQRAFRKCFPLRSPFLPGRSSEDRRPTLVLDLDETLIHTTFDFPCASHEYESVNLTLLGSTKKLYVNLRPWVKFFLKAVAQWYEIVVYTASLSTYANSILDTLDPTKEIFSHRLYREHCSFFKGVYIKDLESLGRSLDKTVFVDNFPGAYMMQPSNALPVRSFIGDTADNELPQLMKLLKILRYKDDVRPLLRRYQTHWKNIHFSSEQSATTQGG